MKSKGILTLTIGAVMLGTAISASAALQTFAGAFGSAENPLPVDETGFPYHLPLQKFDTSLGLLTDIVITLTSMNSVQADVLNLRTASALFENAGASATITVTGDGVQTAAALQTTLFSGSIGAGANSLGPVASGEVSDRSPVAAAGFSAYESSGGGTLDYVLNATAAGTSQITSSPKVYASYDAAVYGTVVIDYYYAPYVAAPEPGTMFAGFSALGVCAFALRRQSRRAA